MESENLAFHQSRVAFYHRLMELADAPPDARRSLLVRASIAAQYAAGVATERDAADVAAMLAALAGAVLLPDPSDVFSLPVHHRPAWAADVLEDVKAVDAERRSR